MPNLVTGSDVRDFWVWVDPKDFLARHNITVTGTFFSAPAEPGSPAMMFLPNPAFMTFISPFQNNLLRGYIAEYNLELTRAASFRQYPCRLHAIFLLESEGDADAYKSLHPQHIFGRILNRGRTVGSYTYSIHDSSWVDFMRLGGSMDPSTIRAVTEAYWSGRAVKDCELQSMGRPWTQDRVPEVLFTGTVEFYDRELDA